MNLIKFKNKDLLGTGRCYNASLIEKNNKIYMFFRYEPHGTYVTEIGVVELNDKFEIVHGTQRRLMIPRVSSKIITIDDPRTILHENKIICVHAQGALSSIYTWSSGVVLANVEIDGSCNKIWLPQYGNNLNYGTQFNNENVDSEKNWSPFIYKDKLRFVYKINPLEIIEYDFDSNQIKLIIKNPEVSMLDTWWGNLFLGGGTPLIEKDNEYCGFFHAFTEDHPGEPDVRTYHTGFYAISKENHALTRISLLPFQTATKDERRDSRDHDARWRPNVIYPCGILEKNEKVYISQGWQDCEIEIVETTWDEILKYTKEIRDGKVSYYNYKVNSKIEV